MSDEDAISAVTDTLRRLVAVGVESVGGAQVITKPPNEMASGGQDRLVNLFLFRTDVDGALRNEDRLDLVAGEIGDQPLPLVLHYLLTPFVRDGNDVVAHQLLGAAIRILHQYPVLDPAELDGSAVPSNVAHQLDRIRITWQPLSEKDIYSLWSAFQAPYRMSVAYEVRPVLIDSTRAPRTPVPVLKRGRQDEGPVARGDVESPFPELLEAVPENGQTVARSGEQVVLRAANAVAQSVEVRLSHPLVAEPVTIPIPPQDVTANEVRFALAGAPDAFPAGLWSVALALTDVLTVDGVEQPVTTVTNEVPLLIAPRITVVEPAVSPDTDGTVVLRVTLGYTPAALPGQPVLMLLDGRAAAPDVTDPPQPPDSPRFTFRHTAPGRHLIRIRVAGVDSVLIDRSGDRPEFDPTQSIIVEEP
ncbi:MAG TPA: DUF4255 domain-containing protein [Actinophytocola sp.]|uniref:DUF4255 domain-containing protein n=1 Tax=Actinophytocola sp. TaxID=1872138 RepID=UPI002DDCB8F4|nr:DUF4255 domain-containing protein [Actinophytocola sp.]HEV2777781.1 DUF4255 domain-containing protein [Actinophytocola sp.]